MLELKNITKIYKTNSEDVHALKGINVKFRNAEFVSILGQSGGGKTTLLNIIGGLDRYTKGDLIINGRSTKDYKDKDWDLYRNYSVGFVFQSYNLIPHQTVLENVELALTISGYNRKEKRDKAIEALKNVGLQDQIHKKPSQLSGGQMQRVAIARAIVNNPSIILADEPTGALDTKTSKQIMDLLKKISKDKLIIMVTHNPEIAEKYSNRILKIVDGKITDDSNPFDESDKKISGDEKGKKRKTQMKFITALHLSFKNLLTKKGRTILTAFAGSIGIIGIALILSLSSGMNDYISNIQKSTMVSYPIRIDKETIDLSSLINSSRELNRSEISKNDSEENSHEKDAVYGNNFTLEQASKISNSVTKNNLNEFKKYLDDKDSEINKYLGENGIVYSYDTNFDIYTYDPNEELINTDGSTFEDDDSNSLMYLGKDSNTNKMMQDSSMMAMAGVNSSNFEKLLCRKDENLVSDVIYKEYDVIYGNMPSKYNELVLVVDRNNEISTTVMYELGLLSGKDYREVLDKLDKNEKLELDIKKIDYQEIMNKKFYLIPSCDYYQKNEKGEFEYIGDDDSKVKEKLKNAVELNITGIIRQKDESDNQLITSSIGYTKALEDYLIDYSNNSEVVKSQLENKDTNVLNGLKFKISTDEEKVEDTKKYLSNLGVSEKANFYKMISTSSNNGQNQIGFMQMNQMTEFDLANAFDMYLQNPDNNMLISIYDNYLSPGSYEKNMESFGMVDVNSPSSISIYTDSFENKDSILECIERYNQKVEEENKISYTDTVGLLMSSITTIINTISYVLIAFVAISLIVSSIMIAIITYISVLERTKEIGILRAMGTSKKDISKIFNAETFIEGLVAGIMGVVITLLINVPINAIILKLTNIENMSKLPFGAAFILIIISVVLTVFAGIIPSRVAAKKDPAEVLRSE